MKGSEILNIFDEIDENLFRPLTGINKRKYVDILTLIWDKCKRMPMYAIEKSTIFDMVEDYFCGLDEEIELRKAKLSNDLLTKEETFVSKLSKEEILDLFE